LTAVVNASDASLDGESACGDRVLKQWKIALSLAVVGAVAAPFVFGTWKARPTKEFLVPLTPDQKEKIAARMEKTNNCEREITYGSKLICETQKRDLERGAESYHGGFAVEGYVAINSAVALGVFVAVFGLAFLIPAIVRAYWRWLNT